MRFVATSNSYLVTTDWFNRLQLTKGLKAAFIDTAADVYNKAEATWLQADRKALTNVGFTVTDYTLVDKTKTQLQQELGEFDVLFVSGGNSFYLLEKALISGFVDLIKENYFADKIYVGSSAGSVLLSHNLEPIKFLDDPQAAESPSYQGIGIINFVIFPHWGNPKFKDRYTAATDYAYTHSQAAFLLTDNQYVITTGEVFELVTVA